MPLLVLITLAEAPQPQATPGGQVASFAEGRADALGMTGPKSLEEEIAELKAAESVDAELEAMKAALKARGK